MAEKPVRNRSSEGVVAIRHPRTDFPQMGWLSKATITFYEPNSGFGWFSETQSFRPDQTKLRYGANSRSKVRQFYQTEPQQGWLYKPIVNDTTEDLYEQSTDYGWYRETQTGQERPWPTKLFYGGKSRSNVRQFYQTEPQQGWLNKPVNLNLYEANSGFGWFSETQSFRTYEQSLFARTRQRSPRLFYQTEPEAVYDPSVLARLHTSWIIPSERLRPHPARDLDRWDQDDATFDVINFSQAFDPATQDWHIDTSRTSQRLGRFLRETVPDNAWMGDHAQLNAWGIPADRMRLGLRYQRDTNTDTSWIFPSLPVFDPAIQDWFQSTAWTKSNRKTLRDTNTDISWIFPNLPAVFDPALWPGTTIDSHRRWNKLTGRWQPDLDHAWIQTSVPVNPPFDATTQFAAIGIPGTRTPGPPFSIVRSPVGTEGGVKVWTITGQTLTCAGAVLASCTVMLFRTSDNAIIGTTTSDGSGNYSFTVSDGTTAYFLVSYHPNAPDTAGTTLNTIVGS